MSLVKLGICFYMKQASQLRPFRSEFLSPSARSLISLIWLVRLFLLREESGAQIQSKVKAVGFNKLMVSFHPFFPVKGVVHAAK